MNTYTTDQVIELWLKYEEYKLDVLSKLEYSTKPRPSLDELPLTFPSWLKSLEDPNFEQKKTYRQKRVDFWKTLSVETQAKLARDFYGIQTIKGLVAMESDMIQVSDLVDNYYLDEVQ
jgi:hypothetical protein